MELHDWKKIENISVSADVLLFSVLSSVICKERVIQQNNRKQQRLLISYHLNDFINSYSLSFWDSSPAVSVRHCGNLILRCASNEPCWPWHICVWQTKLQRHTALKSTEDSFLKMIVCSCSLCSSLMWLRSTMCDFATTRVFMTSFLRPAVQTLLETSGFFDSGSSLVWDVPPQSLQASTA